MPKIPLYNQGAGPTVGVAAGQLSPRASAAAFTAPGKATMGYQKVFSDIGNVAAEFELGRQGVEADTLDSQISTEIDRGLSELNRERLDNPTEFRKRAEEVYKNATAGIDSANINSKLKQGLKYKVGNRFRALSLSGEQQAFTQGLENSAIEFSSFVTTVQSQLRSDPSLYEQLRGDLSIKLDSMVESGAVQYLKQTPQQILAGFEQENFSVTVAQKNSVSEVNALKEEAKSRNLTQSQLNDYNTIADNKITELRSLAFDAGLEFAQTAPIEINEADDAIQELYEKQQITLPDGTVQDYSNVDRSRYGAISQAISDNVSDQEDLQSDLIISGYNSSEDIKSSIEQSYSPDAPHSKTPEQMDALNLTFIEQNVDSALASMETGNYNAEDVANVLKQADELLTTEFAGRSALLSKTDSRGEKARRIQLAIGKAVGELNKAVTTAVTTDAYTQAIEDKKAPLADSLVKPEEKTDAINKVMQKYADDPLMQINLLSANDLKFETFDARLTMGYTMGMSPEYDPSETGDDDSLKQSIELYRQMQLYTPALLNHTTPDERTFYESILTLEPHMGLNAAISTVKTKRDDIDINAKYKTIEQQVQSLSDDQTDYAWYSYIPFLEGKKFVPENVSGMKTDIEILAKEYISLGVDATKAVELAAKDYGKSHKRIRNTSVPITIGLPENMEELADLAVGKVTLLYPDVMEQFEDNELSLAPVDIKRNDKWYVTHSGGIPVFDKNGNALQFDVGEPLQEDMPGIMGGMIPAGSYPPDSLRGMLATQESVDNQVSLLEEIYNQNIEIEAKTKTGDFEGLSPYEVSRLKKIKQGQFMDILSLKVSEEDGKREVEILKTEDGRITITLPRRPEVSEDMLDVEQGGGFMLRQKQVLEGSK